MPDSGDRRCVACDMAITQLNHAAQKFCGATCRTRWNNEMAKSRPVADDEHGRRIGYKRGCRCDVCKKWCADASRAWRARQPKMPPKPRKNKTGRRVPVAHGTSSEYSRGCRCIGCTAARTQQNAEWARRNPEKFKANQRRYRQRNPRVDFPRIAAAFDDEAVRYAELIRTDPCVYCGRPSDTLDHIRPVSLSLSSQWENLAPACRSCNSAKGTKDLLTFLLRRQSQPA